MQPAWLIWLVRSKAVPPWLLWPILAALVIAGMFIGSIYGEIISAYRTWRHRRLERE